MRRSSLLSNTKLGPFLTNSREGYTKLKTSAKESKSRQRRKKRMRAGVMKRMRRTQPLHAMKISRWKMINLPWLLTILTKT
jgi:hypothetical protein